MSDDGDKNPQEQFKQLIKSGVSAANIGLQKVQTTYHGWQEPISLTKKSIEEHSAIAMETVKTVYQKRKQYNVQIIGGSTLMTGGYLLLRRGKIAGAFGAVVGAGAAYSVVYDEFPPIDIEKMLPNIIFGKKDE